jgi:hypothetical protein
MEFHLINQSLTYLVANHRTHNSILHSLRYSIEMPHFFKISYNYHHEKKTEKNKKVENM